MTNIHVAFITCQALFYVLLYVLTSLILTINLWGRNSNYPHFTNMEVEVYSLLKVILPISGRAGIRTQVVEFQSLELNHSQHFAASLAKTKWINGWSNVAPPKQNENTTFRSGKSRSFCFPPEITWKCRVFILLLKSPPLRPHPPSHPCQRVHLKRVQLPKVSPAHHLIYASYLQSELKAPTSATSFPKNINFFKKRKNKESDHL